ncbi:MAG TPA: DUF262 domain-containing protein [Gemmataceae bacterium]
MLELKKQQMLVVNPEYQRGIVWTTAQRKKLVDSVLRGYPLPLIYLHYIEQKAGPLTCQRYEVIDGQQRITALADFHEGAFKLFAPEKDAKEARFPQFIKREECPWGGFAWQELSDSDRTRFLETLLPVVYIETHNPSEARDLFVRLQAGMPLNSQEKRDAWPGQFTDFVLSLGGKPGLARYPGHDFFGLLMRANKAKDRGKFRQLAAQIAMLFLTKQRSKGKIVCDINSAAIDDFYYENLEFDAESNDARRLLDILDKVVTLLRDRKRKPILGHEAIHLVLLVDTLWDEYTRSWEGALATSFDEFRKALAASVLTATHQKPDDHWLRYGIFTRVNSDRAENIRRRQDFFQKEMWRLLKPRLKDPTRLFGPIEREIIYYRHGKLCAVCAAEVQWDEAQFHHIETHINGGLTELPNGVLVHRHCHPRGDAALKFAKEWRERSRGMPAPMILDQSFPPVETTDESEGRSFLADVRIPPIGTVIQKRGRGGDIRAECTVVEGGIRYKSKIYKSLTAAARAAAKDLGLSCAAVNGFAFWRLVPPTRPESGASMREVMVYVVSSENPDQKYIVIAPDHDEARQKIEHRYGATVRSVCSHSHRVQCDSCKEYREILLEDGNGEYVCERCAAR